MPGAPDRTTRFVGPCLSYDAKWNAGSIYSEFHIGRHTRSRFRASPLSRGLALNSQIRRDFADGPAIRIGNRLYQRRLHRRQLRLIDQVKLLQNRKSQDIQPTV